MILSFHPCYDADINILCAGRDPGASDLAAIRAADAVILPQGCRESLYRMTAQNSRHVFPNYDARFRYPGKTGQAKLFQALEAPHPRTWVFGTLSEFRQRGSFAVANGFPLVLKLDWGGEGDTVFLLQSHSDLDLALATAEQYERTGQAGFVVQTFIPHKQRTLRVVVIGQSLTAYWRIQEHPAVFGTSVSKGARIETASDPTQRQRARSLTQDLCRRSGINLAGFDFIFDESEDVAASFEPLCLEVNYFFGRSGLGGSERYYRLLRTEIDRWLNSLGLASRDKEEP
jgi:ribosomal protein S6--L-glutamate ligase